jgi:FkbM family methyltransferase
MGILASLKSIARHPLTARRKREAFLDYFLWNILVRMSPGPIAVPFVDSTRLLIGSGMAGAVGNYYMGIDDYEEMSFLLHLLQKKDVFFDIGANVGAYSVLASGVVGSRSVALEPVPPTFAALMDNIRLNGIEERVSCLDRGVGSAAGMCRMTASHGTMNHVLASGEKGEGTLSVSICTIDQLAEQWGVPALVKIDVEGYESEVLKGARGTLENRALLAVIIELNGAGSRYGVSDSQVCSQLAACGFEARQYHPALRKLTPVSAKRVNSKNMIYVRGITEIERRLSAGRRNRTRRGIV